MTHRALTGPRPHNPGSEIASKKELLYTLERVREVRAKFGRERAADRPASPAEGITWTEIATAIGVSRQAAWERLREMDEARA